MSQILFFILVSSFAVSFLATPLTIRLAHRYRLVDDKKRRHPAKVHRGSIPRAGGLPVYLGIFVSCLLLLLFFGLDKKILGVLLGATTLLLVGLADDKKEINPYSRFITNIIAAAFVVAVGINIPFINNPLTYEIIHLDSWRISFDFFKYSFSFLPLPNLLAILWIVWTMNIVGWSAGVDGQLPGLVVIAAVSLGILSWRFLPDDSNQLLVIALSLSTAGSYLGFLWWNFYPQKIMPGYSGKTLAGFMLATMAILAQAKVGTAILVLGVPMVDAAFTFLRRLSYKRSPVWPDKGHLHHRLLDLGWGKRRIAIFYWLITALLGLVALTVTSRIKLFVVLLLAVWIGGLIAWASIIKALR